MSPTNFILCEFVNTFSAASAHSGHSQAPGSLRSAAGSGVLTPPHGPWSSSAIKATNYPVQSPPQSIGGVQHSCFPSGSYLCHTAQRSPHGVTLTEGGEMRTCRNTPASLTDLWGKRRTGDHTVSPLTRFVLAVTKAFVVFQPKVFPSNHCQLHLSLTPAVLSLWDPGVNVGWDKEEEGQICFKGGNHRLDSSVRSLNKIFSHCL